MHFNSLFSHFALLPLYIYLPIALHVIPCQLHTQKKKNDVIYLQSFGDTYLAIILPCLSLVQLRKEGLHFVLSDNDDYDFDVKVGRCEFVGFVNDVINCGCLRCVCCFRIKEKEKDTLYIKFNSIIFLQNFLFSFLQLNNYNE